MKTARAFLLALLPLLVVAAPALLKQSAWETIKLVQTPVPQDVASIPLLRDLPKDPPDRAEQIRAKGVKFAFVTYPDGGKPELPSTAYVCFTPTHLVAVLEGRQSNDYELLARPQEKEDGHIWNDDNFEIFVDPFLSRSEYIHFIVNPLGDVFDQRCYEKRVSDPKAADPAATIVQVIQEREYDSGANVPVLRDTDQWAALFHLPFTAFGLKAPPLGQVWGLNFCHTNRENKELSQWRATPGRSGFHQPRRFGALRFGEAVAGLEAEVDMPHFGAGRNLLIATVRNPEAKEAKLRWQVLVTDAAAKVVSRDSGTLRAAPGESKHALAFDVPFALRGRCRVAVEITEKGRTVAYVVYNPSLGEPVALGVPLTQIYTTDTAVEGTLRLNLGGGELGEKGKAVTLELGGMKQRRRVRFAKPEGNVLRFQVDTQGLPPGEYVLRAVYGHRKSCEQPLTIIAAPFAF
ncbi:MAG: hypothetical protein HN380_19640 [Victivallales bacterium]|nr:hypothetical protein [Victivallales bacterium]